MPHRVLPANVLAAEKGEIVNEPIVDLLQRGLIVVLCCDERVDEKSRSVEKKTFYCHCNQRNVRVGRFLMASIVFTRILNLYIEVGFNL